jgi:hypothetical protein
MASLNARRGTGASWRSKDTKSGGGASNSVSNVFSFPQFRREETSQTTPSVVHITTVTEQDDYHTDNGLVKVFIALSLA